MLSKQARALIEYFENQLKGLPADERESVLKRMTSHVNTLNEEVESLLQTLEKTPADAHEKREEQLDKIEDQIQDYK